MEEELNGTKNSKRPRKDSDSDDEEKPEPGPSAQAEVEPITLPSQEVLDKIFDRIGAQLPKDDSLKFTSRS